MAPAPTLRNPDTDWFSQAKLGAFMHFLLGPDTFPLTEQFDVEALADQLQDAGASYFCITLGQNTGYFIAPNPVYDEIGGFQPGERCSTRDIPREIALACRKRGIRTFLYLPCQTPNRDLKAVTAFGFPADAKDCDRAFTVLGYENWARVISWWSTHYGDLISGWWFDGGYARINFNDTIAAHYAAAAKAGNPHSLVTFNPGVSFKRATAAEDYVAGEINEPFRTDVTQRWIDNSQAHILTYLGDTWGKANCRYLDCVWIAWLRHVTAVGCPVTLDMGPNFNSANGPVGTFTPAQIQQFKRLRQALNE